ncbi:CHAP domain-containing protein [Cystobacter fuscus]
MRHGQPSRRKALRLELPLQPADAPRGPRPIPDDGVDAAPAPTASGDSSTDGAASAPEPRRSPGPDAREKVLAAARGLLGRTKIQLSGRSWPADCTGFVEAVHSRAGVSLRGAAAKGDNGVTAFYRYARAKGRVYTQGTPRPGDLVFFRETYDRNRDGRRNDGLTHVALVDKVEPNGTVVVIHRVKRGVVRYRMNLARPDLKKDPRTGAVLNDSLRAPGAGKAPVLTGQLFAAYGSVLPEPRPEAVARR